jgi:hypothetical protein
MTTTVEIFKAGTSVIELSPAITEVELTTTRTVVEVGIGLPAVSSTSIVVEPTGIITATTLQGALEQLAAQTFKQPDMPTGQNVDEGDTWYNTENESLYVYRETSPGVFEWKPIMIGTDSTTSDMIDAGAF